MRLQLCLSPLNFSLLRIAFNYKEPCSLCAHSYPYATQETEESLRSTGLDPLAVITWSTLAAAARPPTHLACGSMRQRSKGIDSKLSVLNQQFAWDHLLGLYLGQNIISQQDVDLWPISELLCYAFGSLWIASDILSPKLYIFRYLFYEMLHPVLL